MSKYTQEDLDRAKLHHNRTRECPLVRYTAQLIADTREAATKAERERCAEIADNYCGRDCDCTCERIRSGE